MDLKRFKNIEKEEEKKKKTKKQKNKKRERCYLVLRSTKGWSPVFPVKIDDSCEPNKYLLESLQRCFPF